MRYPEFKNKHILSTRDLMRQELLVILDAAARMEKCVHEQGICPLLDRSLSAMLFLEPSTRTRLSFEAAALRLGARTVSVSEAGSSSAAKGESLADMIRVVAGYADCIVLRQPRQGQAAAAAGLIRIPLINAGDGAGQHPTQALLDLYTIRRELGALESLKVAIVGDLKYGRTVHSLFYALLPFGPQYIFCAPRELEMPVHILEDAAKNRISVSQTQNLEDALQADIIYMTRIQKERFTDQEEYERLKDSFVLSRDLVERINRDILIMHPLPRVNEISEDVDGLARAAYFRQAQNGMYVRMALLALVLGADIP
jgi:aspartate carbamoyltransferase catalytic subunit